MSVSASNFGIQGFSFPVVDSGGGSCDYPGESDVRLGVSYDSGNLVGALTLPDEGDVRLGVGYGADATEYTGSLVVPTPPVDPGEVHSPADVLRYLLVQMGHGDYPSLTGQNVTWPTFVSVEPSKPDNVVTVYNTTGTNDGRIQFTGEQSRHYGIQVRVRSATYGVGYAKAKRLAVAMAEDIYGEEVVIGASSYTVNCLAKVGDVLELGKELPDSKRNIFVINALMSVKPSP